MEEKSLLFIAGPCSAESEAQLLNIADFLAKNTPTQYFRAGAWKPRTSPGAFEGYGEEALLWLSEVKAKTSLNVMTEVGNAKHVEAVLRHQLDAVWIGARTSGNPFSVQEIAQALKGSKLPVFVKNPLSPDLRAWIGAIERFEKAGIEKVIGVHRGFQLPHQENALLRNAPEWHLAIKFKQERPDVPLICDVSHMAGNTDFIPAMAQQAIDLEMDGLMLEIHQNPAEAKTDQEQQLDFAASKKLFDQLIFKSKGDNISEIKALRAMIDELDDQLLGLLAKRFEYVQKIGRHKKQNRLSVLQMDRWNEVVRDRLQKASHYALDEDFVKELLQAIHKEALRIQTEQR